MDFALNNLQWLMCHKTKPNQTNYIKQKLIIRNRIASTFFSFYIRVQV